ncbi:lipopolysaccharide biosynthesis protein [Tianweitania sp.]|uniref:lipopolysaccharide biosynthesis protein n=1 Tax=Tianweitania sp. TaxID=2021634 RepID=UPI0028A0660C|nr:lipopolysaccharide biosynthesis protein [Tianweitania sp.]
MKISNILGYAFGPITAALIGVVALPITAWVFSPSDIGRLNVFQVCLSFGLLLSTFGLDRAYIREYHESSDRLHLFAACFLPGLLLIAVLVVLTLPVRESAVQWLYSTRDASLYLITVLALVANYISRFLSLIVRMQERGWAYSMSQVLPKLLSLTLIGSVFLSGAHANFRLLQGITFASILVVMLVFAWNTRQDWIQMSSARIRWAEMRKLLAYGFPLVFSGLAYWGLTATSTFALRHWSSLDELAVYSVVNSFAGAAVIFQSIFATIWAPTVYKWVAHGIDMRRVDVVARHALLIVCLIFIAVGLFSWTVDYLLPPHYRMVKYLLAAAIAPSLLYTLSEVTTVGIGISRRTGWTIWITVAALLVNAAMSWWLVPQYGSAGAVLSNAAAFFVFFLLRTEVSAALWRQFPRAKLYVMLCGMISLAAAIVGSAERLPPLYPFIWLVPLGIVIVVCRSEIFDMFAIAKNRLGVRT